MNELTVWMDKPLIKNQAGQTVVSNGHLLAAAAGIAALYFMIPERKRKTLFK